MAIMSSLDTSVVSQHQTLGIQEDPFLRNIFSANS
jgi:hypothetical protein